MTVWESTLQRHIPGESLSRVTSLFMASILALLAVPDVRRLRGDPEPHTTRAAAPEILAP